MFAQVKALESHEAPDPESKEMVMLHAVLRASHQQAMLELSQDAGAEQ